MAKEFAKTFYKSTAWKKCRESFIQSRYGLCERCGRPGKIVHHKVILNPSNINNPDITLNWSNLELLCQDCHNKEHHENIQPITREGLMFDSKGDLIKSPLKIL